MSRPTRYGTAEPVSRDQILRRERGQGNIRVPCSAEHEQDWQPYPVDPYSAIWDDYTYTYLLIVATIATSRRQSPAYARDLLVISSTLGKTYNAECYALSAAT